MPETPGENTPAEGFLDLVQDLKAVGKKIDLVEATIPPGLQGAEMLTHLAQQLGCDVRAIHKTVCLNYKDATGRHLVAVIVPASSRVSQNKVAQFLGVNQVKPAQRDFIEAETGFVPGGIPPVGFPATRLVDASVFQHSQIYAGGGNNLNKYTAMDPQLLAEIHPDIKVGDFQE